MWEKKKSSRSVVFDSATPWTVAHQAPLSMEFSRQECWSGLPFPSGFNPWVGKIHRRRERLPTPAFWPGEFHGLYSPWGCKESDTTEQLSLSFCQIPNQYLSKCEKLFDTALFLYLFIHSFLAILRLHCCMWAFCSCREWQTIL